jgi:predicted nuclease with TOPRIM domain
MLELKDKMETQDEYLDDLIKKLYRDNSRLEGDLQTLNSKLAKITEEYDEKSSLEQEHVGRLEKLEKDFVKAESMYDIVNGEVERLREKNEELDNQLSTLSDVLGSILDRVKKGENIFLENPTDQGKY